MQLAVCCVTFEFRVAAKALEFCNVKSSDGILRFVFFGSSKIPSWSQSKAVARRDVAFGGACFFSSRFFNGGRAEEAFASLSHPKEARYLLANLNSSRVKRASFSLNRPYSAQVVLALALISGKVSLKSLH